MYKRQEPALSDRGKQPRSGRPNVIRCAPIDQYTVHNGIEFLTSGNLLRGIFYVLMIKHMLSHASSIYKNEVTMRIEKVSLSNKKYNNNNNW